MSYSVTLSPSPDGFCLVDQNGCPDPVISSHSSQQKRRKGGEGISPLLRTLPKSCIYSLHKCHTDQSQHKAIKASREDEKCDLRSGVSAATCECASQTSDCRDYNHWRSPAAVFQNPSLRLQGGHASRKLPQPGCIRNTEAPVVVVAQPL